MRWIVTLVFALWCVSAALADSIITRSADIIECKVTQVGDAVVTYRKAGESFDREINRGDVFKVKYDNGEEECFPAARQHDNASVARQGTGTQDRVAPRSYANTQTEPDWSAFPPASR